MTAGLPTTDTLEGLVIGALQSRLMDPTLLAEFCDESHVT